MRDDGPIPRMAVEPFRNLSAPVCIGNGREGNGREWKGDPVETSIISSGSVAREPADAMMQLDFDPTCSTNACHAAPNPAAYAVRWVRHLQPTLGHGVWFMCDSCWRGGLTVMTQCPSGVLWRIVEVLR